jgi:hypothetical protein
MADEQKQELSVRDKLHRERLDRARKMTPDVGRVRVLPRNDDVRKYIVHQPSLIAFPESGSVEWPDDAFTRRRIADGDVTLEEQPKSSESAPAQPQASRGSAAATS